MKVVPSLLLICTGILLATIPALADTVTLKSGEVLNGQITSETDQEIAMDVIISAGITDQKTVAKADVQSTSKTPPDEVAYQTLKDCQISARSLRSSNYAAIIKSLEAFLQQFPQSPRVDEVKAALEAFKTEQARVAAGELKWNNHWYTAKEAEKNKYQLHAQMILSTMKEQASRRDFVGALNGFDLIEKYYPGSSSYPDAIELAQNMIRVAAADTDRLQAAAKTQESQFTNGIVLVPEPQKSIMLAARQSQITAADATLAAAERSGVKWKPLIPVSTKSFEGMKTTIASESTRLQALPVPAMRKSIACVADAEEELRYNNLMNAEAKLKEAGTLWTQNERLISLNAEVSTIKAKAKAATPTPSPSAKAAASATPAHTPAPTPAHTPVPTPTPKPKNWFGL